MGPLLPKKIQNKLSFFSDKEILDLVRPPLLFGNCQNIVKHFCPFLGSPRLFRGETLPAAYFLASLRLSLFKISRYNFKFILWAMQKYLKKTSSVQHPTGQANLISNHPFLCLQSLMKRYE